ERPAVGFSWMSQRSTSVRTSGLRRLSICRSGEAAFARLRSCEMTAFAARLPPLAEGADGVIRVAGTRVQLETIVRAFEVGATPEEIAQQFPSISLAGVYAVLAWVLENQGAVAAYVAAREAVASKVRA